MAVLMLLCACDNRQVLRAPDPSLSRMLKQNRTSPYGGEMRTPPPGTVPRDDVDDAPPPRTRELLAAGRARFETICAACHGIIGDGRSVVATKMSLRAPPSLLTPRTPSDLYTTMTQGYGLMPSYADMLEPRERWAVAAYVQALQLSQRAPIAALPPDVRASLEKEVP
jgi:mono/diheme cytochrome c family protein